MVKTERHYKLIRGRLENGIFPDPTDSKLFIGLTMLAKELGLPLSRFKPKLVAPGTLTVRNIEAIATVIGFPPERIFEVAFCKQRELDLKRPRRTKPTKGKYDK